MCVCCVVLCCVVCVCVCVCVRVCVCVCVCVCVLCRVIPILNRSPPLLQRALPGHSRRRRWCTGRRYSWRSRENRSGACLHAQTHRHTHRHTDTHTDIQTRTHARTHRQTHRHTDTQTHRHTHARTKTHTHTHRHTDSQTDTHTHTYPLQENTARVSPRRATYPRLQPAIRLHPLWICCCQAHSDGTPHPCLLSLLSLLSSKSSHAAVSHNKSSNGRNSSKQQSKKEANQRANKKAHKGKQRQATKQDVMKCKLTEADFSERKASPGRGGGRKEDARGCRYNLQQHFAQREFDNNGMTASLAT